MKAEQITAALDLAVEQNKVAKMAIAMGFTRCDLIDFFLFLLVRFPLAGPIFRTARSLLRGYLEDWKREKCSQ